MMDKLPIDAYIDSMISSKARSLVVAASPGSGKTTRLPPAVAKITTGKVLCVEPRRLACIAAASRIAAETGTRLGDEIGYHVRLEKKCTSKTKLCFVTTGMLLQYLCADAFLENISVIIFDEFHERSLEADITLAMVRFLQHEVRDDLRIIVMSATLDYASISSYLGTCETFHIDAPIYPLEIQYASKNDGMKFYEYAEEMMHGVEISLNRYDGDCLIFLPGLADIHSAIDLARARFGDRYAYAASHASLSLDAQKQLLNPPSNARRLIFSTNVAESSLTIPGVSCVVDVGLAKRKFFDSISGLSRLETQRISLASAEQRAGRAARLGPGFCYRVWDELAQRNMEPQTLPEIERLDLSQAVLQIAAWGLESPENLDFLSKPADGRIADARNLLKNLGAMDETGLTELGTRMARLPVEPRLARWLIEAQKLGCLRDAALLAAYLSEAPYRRAQRENWPGPDLYVDFEKLKKEIKKPEMAPLRRIADDIAESARELNHQASRPTMDVREALCRSMLSAYPDRLAQARPNKGEKLAASDPRRLLQPVYVCMSGSRGAVVREAQSLRDASFFICADLDLVKGVERASSNVLKAMAVDPKWIPWREDVIARYEPDKDRVVVARSVHFDIFTLRETFLHGDEYQDLARKTLLEAALKSPSKVLNLESDDFCQLRARLKFIKKLNPALEIPAFDEEWGKTLLERMVRRADSFESLFSQNLTAFAREALDMHLQHLLKTQAPERIVLENGFETGVDYTGEPPIVRVKIQKAFGTHQVPKVGGVPVIMHLCAPNGQPAQMTQDLQSFWHHTYADVRKLLRGRYPKHQWPENPE